MRILFDSKNTLYKSPFGCLIPHQECTLHIHIPCTVLTSAVTVCLAQENGEVIQNIPMTRFRVCPPYDIWQGRFSMGQTGLFFYHFRITGHTGTFRLFKQGDDTNMEAGDCWQLSCIPADLSTPDWAKGAVIYQVFPDRFHKAGSCDLTGKLQPYLLHNSWEEEVVWQPNEQGKVLNNDFFGGNFRGITEKLDHIAAMGATVLYLNPISKSFSNHRYDTGDYKTPDPMLGTLEDFRALCEAAHARGIRVVLDGVFAHTGDNSLYFDKYRTFGGNGAYSDPRSPYRSWYTFSAEPDSYTSWWGFDTLPTVNKTDPGYLDYIITGKDSVVAHWLRQGTDGFRLDVADELPDSFIALLKQRLRQIKPDGLLMGEVWEDASNKIAYGIRRRYFVDGELDSVMNYPFRTAIIDFVRGKDGGQALKNTVLTILENYPQQVSLCNMNLLGSHDTPRILTALVDPFRGSRAESAARHLSARQLLEGIALLETATLLQFTLPGCPSIYYGDEVGMEGDEDPFNRRPYPWGKEDTALTAHYKALGQLRKTCVPLRLGSTEFFHAEGQRLGFTRRCADHQIRIYVNQSANPWEIPPGKVLIEKNLTATPGSFFLAPRGWCITEESSMEKEAFFSGYCRQLDNSRTVCVVAEDKELTEVDCLYPDCPYAPDCPIAASIREFSDSL